MRTIDADDLKKVLDEQMNFEENCRDSVFEIVDNAPTVVNEYTKGFTDGERSGRNFPLTDEEKTILVNQWLPKGKWGNVFEYREDRYHKCSNCHFSIKLTNFDNFCPNCGADMREGDEE